MNWLTYLIPRTVYKTTSRFNKDIRVVEESGKYKLLVNGSRESGPFIERLWGDALRMLHLTTVSQMKRILVLGVAGGTVMRLLRERYPHAAITGVDIDDAMINIGKKYFGLNGMESFTCVVDDAKHYVSTYKGALFDCVVIDLFIGTDVPAFVQSQDFQKKIRHVMMPHGFTLINYAFSSGSKDRAADIHSALKSLYPTVRRHDTVYNRFFLAK